MGREADAVGRCGQRRSASLYTVSATGDAQPSTYNAVPQNRMNSPSARDYMIPIPRA